MQFDERQGLAHGAACQNGTETVLMRTMKAGRGRVLYK